MISNQTTNKIVSSQEMVCRTFLSQALGLMFRRKRNLVMVFPKEKKIRLHMLFVFYPIDVLILDRNKKIVEIKRNFKPFTFWSSKQKCKYVVELAYPSQYKLNDYFLKLSF